MDRGSMDREITQENAIKSNIGFNTFLYGNKDRFDETPSTVTELAAALAALRRYAGENTKAEHEAEIKRLGSANYYRMMLANALVGVVETEVFLTNRTGITHEQISSAYMQARLSAEAEHSPAKLFGFLRWRTLVNPRILREEFV